VLVVNVGANVTKMVAKETAELIGRDVPTAENPWVDVHFYKWTLEEKGIVTGFALGAVTAAVHSGVSGNWKWGVVAGILAVVSVGAYALGYSRKKGSALTVTFNGTSWTVKGETKTMVTPATLNVERIETLLGEPHLYRRGVTLRASTSNASVTGQIPERLVNGIVWMKPYLVGVVTKGGIETNRTTRDLLDLPESK
jgi:hypothetical protein